MPCSMSGVLASNKLWNFQQTHIWTSIKVMSTLSNSFGRNGAVLSAPWGQTFIQVQGEFAKPHYCCIIDWLGHGSTAIETAGPLGVPIAELNFDDLKGWAPCNAFNKPRCQPSHCKSILLIALTPTDLYLQSTVGLLYLFTLFILLVQESCSDGFSNWTVT